ncbi:unnamed protein product [Prunus armeniaca]
MAEAFKFKLLQSTPYYAQANGQAESSNKLSETLWAYRTSKREATGMTPYALTYGHDAILPMEIVVQSLRIAHQHNLVGENYSQAMLLELEGLDASRIDTLNKLQTGKQAVSKAYNKRVKNKSFEEGEIVWKAVLPLGTHVAGYGKWSPTWEDPFIINQILGMGAYRLQDRDGEIHAAPINGKWLKKFYPTMWDSLLFRVILGWPRSCNHALHKEGGLSHGAQSSPKLVLHLPALCQLLLKLFNLLLQLVCSGLGLLVSRHHLVQFCLLLCKISQVGFMSSLAELRGFEGRLEILISIVEVKHISCQAKAHLKYGLGRYVLSVQQVQVFHQLVNGFPILIQLQLSGLPDL